MRLPRVRVRLAVAMILVALAALAAEGEVLRRRSVSARQIAATHATLAAIERSSAVASHDETFLARDVDGICRTFPAPGAEAHEAEHLAMAEFHDRLADRWNAAASRPWSCEAWVEICAVRIDYHRRKRTALAEAEQAALTKIREWERTSAELRRRRVEGSFTCDDALFGEWENQIARERAIVTRAEFYSRMIAKYEAAASQPWVPIEPDPPEPRLLPQGRRAPR